MPARLHGVWTAASTFSCPNLGITRGRETAAIRHHYDVSHDFYGLWLDRNVVYSCAYFRTGTEDISTAQRQKLEHIFRKLRLAPGERLVDIGCGWGGLLRAEKLWSFPLVASNHQKM